MSNDVAARHYGRAFYEVAIEEAALEAVLTQLETVRDLLAVPQVRQFWHHPQIAVADKLETVNALLSEQLMPLNRRFLALLLSKRREGFLTEIILQVYQIRRDEQGILVAKLSSASPLETEAEAKLIARLSRRYNRKIELEASVDPSLLGGFAVRVGDDLLDGTLKRRLQRLHEYLLPQFRA